MKLYIAGKIAPWRDQLFTPSTQGNTFKLAWQPTEMHEFLKPHIGWWYCGPYFEKDQHCPIGSACLEEQPPTILHGMVANSPNANYALLDKRKTHSRSLRNIQNADAVVAYIDSLDCFGTICEIGYAKGIKVPVFVLLGTALSKADKDDLWFVLEGCFKVLDNIQEKNILHTIQNGIL